MSSAHAVTECDTVLQVEVITRSLLENIWAFRGSSRLARVDALALQIHTGP